MSEPPVPNEVRETFAGLAAEPEDASAIAAQAQSVLTEEEAGKFSQPSQLFAESDARLA
jgi:hypothetical protein